MINDVGRRGVAAGAAEPLATGQASDNGTWIMNAAIPDLEISA